MRTCATGSMAKAVNQPAEAAAPMNPASSDARQARSTRTITAGARAASQPPSSSVCSNCAASSVAAAAIRNGVSPSASAAPR